MDREASVDIEERELYKHFSTEEIRLEHKDAKIYGIYKSAVDKNICFYIKIAKGILKIHGIKYENEVNCALKGNDILKKLISVAKGLGLSRVELYDTSKIIREHDADIYLHSYPLYYYFILTKGESWYNSKGFHSEEYEHEKEFNRRIRETPFLQLSLDLALDDAKKTKTKNKSKKTENLEKKHQQFSKDRIEIVEALYTQGGIIVHEDTTVEEMMDSVNKQRDEEWMFDIIIKIIDFFVNYRLIVYDQNLLLELQEVDLDQKKEGSREPETKTTSTTIKTKKRKMSRGGKTKTKTRK